MITQFIIAYLFEFFIDNASDKSCESASSISDLFIFQYLQSVGADKAVINGYSLFVSEYISKILFGITSDMLQVYWVEIRPAVGANEKEARKHHKECDDKNIYGVLMVFEVSCYILFINNKYIPPLLYLFL